MPLSSLIWVRRGYCQVGAPDQLEEGFDELPVQVYCFSAFPEGVLHELDQFLLHLFYVFGLSD